MRYVIQEGKHRAKPHLINIWYDKRVLEAVVSFKENCRYDLNNINQLDTNKLIGLGFTSWWKVLLVAGVAFLGGPILSNEHHKDSARIGWRYEEESDKILLSAYCYVNKKRFIYDLCKIGINTLVTCKIITTDRDYRFEVMEEGKNCQYQLVPHNHKKKFSFPLGVYFGGNEVAPHTMHVDMQQI